MPVELLGRDEMRFGRAPRKNGRGFVKCIFLSFPMTEA